MYQTSEHSKHSCSDFCVHKLDKYSRDGSITLDLDPLNNEHLEYIS